MLSKRRDQSILYFGHIASGKTTNYYSSLQFLLKLCACNNNNCLTLDKLFAIRTILEQFGNCKTSNNENATKFLLMFKVNFNQRGAIVSTNLQTILFEKSGILRKNDNGNLFRIVKTLLLNCKDEQLTRELYLDGLASGKWFDNHDEQFGNDFLHLIHAFDRLDVTKMEQKIIWTLLSAMLHLQCASVTKSKKTF